MTNSKFLLTCSCTICKREIPVQSLKLHNAKHTKPVLYKYFCKQCGAPTNNPKFCSSSCSASVNNKLFPKRIPITKQLPYEKRNDRIKNIDRKSIELSRNKNITIGEIKSRHKNSHISWVKGVIRSSVRTWNKDLIKLPCAKCGYDKFVELAHIKALSSFPDTATLGEVHGSTNVIQLCPNCHWELDNTKAEDFKDLIEWVKSGRLKI